MQANVYRWLLIALRLQRLPDQQYCLLYPPTYVDLRTQLLYTQNPLQMNTTISIDIITPEYDGIIT